jgi:hypothetical protein
MRLAARCADQRTATPYDRYRAANPDWVSVLPSVGIELPELIASLYAPPLGDYQLLVRRIAIYRTDVEPWSPVAVEDLLSGEVQPSAEHGYAVLAATSCQSTNQLESFREDQRSWYLLPHGKLAYYDHYDFGERCVYGNDYLPSVPPFVADEKRLIEAMEAFPKSSFTWSNQTYRKGLLLLQVGRIDDAEAMLHTGDAELDSGGEKGGQVRFDPGRAVEMDRAEHERWLRQLLLEGLAAARARPPP